MVTQEHLQFEELVVPRCGERPAVAEGKGRHAGHVLQLILSLELCGLLC